MNASNRPAVYARPFHTREAAAWLGLSERSVLELARKGILQGKNGASPQRNNLIGGLYYGTVHSQIF